MINRETTNQLALNSASKRTEPLSVAETARRPAPRRLLPQYWCTACAKLSWMVTLEEATRILALPSPTKAPSKQSLIQTIPKGHELKTSTGERLLCINSLFIGAF
jgi:hypothetical protein